MPEPSNPVVDRDVVQSLKRAGVYRMLAAAFAYPTAPRVEELARSCSTLALGFDAGALRDALAALAVAAYQADALALGDEHVFLFDRQVRCPARESAWGDAPQMAGPGALLADLAGFYAAFGLEPAAGQPSTEDHLVAELEFMSALALKEAWARSEGDREGEEILRAGARSFLTDHLGRWAERFADEVQSATPVPLYVAAAKTLAAWIRADVAALDAGPRPVTARLGDDPLQADTFTCPMAAADDGTEPDPLDA